LGNNLALCGVFSVYLSTDTSYAVVGFGAASPPRDRYFLVLFAGKAGKEYEKRMILGGPAAPGTLWVNLPLGGRLRKSCQLIRKY
jgi:hypothetical protein